MSTQPARGMRDFLPDDLRRREHVVGVVRDVYERYGFEPLETPAVENIETLIGKYGEESNKLIFKILKRGEHEASGQPDLALRYDLTVPLARVVAEYQAKLPKFFKRYQIQPVWRADRPARGRFREFYQCDIDVVGSRSLVVETELCSGASEVLAALGFSDFSIRLNHRELLPGILDASGIAERWHAHALVALDKLDKIGEEGVVAEMTQRNISREAASTALQMIEVGRNPELLEAALKGLPTARDRNNVVVPPSVLEAALKGLRTARDRSHVAVPPSVLEAALKGVLHAWYQGHAIDAIRTIIELSQHTPAAGRIKFDPSLARGLSYYTGAIMEINVPDMPGSLGGGGRYDNLIGIFLGRDVPACGFSLGLERILVIMGERNMFPDSVVRASSDVMVTLWSDETRADALVLASTLRAGGLRVDVYPEVDKIGKQFKYASSREVPFVTVVGDDERKNGTVTVKDMRSGDQNIVSREEVVGYISARLPARNALKFDDPRFHVSEGL